MKLILGLDIGGTHVAGALVDEQTGALKDKSHRQCNLDSDAGSQAVLQGWKKVIEDIVQGIDIKELEGIGIAMPGPFDYDAGISLIKGLGKYDALYGMNVKEALKKELQLPAGYPVYFQNDAVCFALGEYWSGAASSYQRVLALTLGTGLGAAFLQNGHPSEAGQGIPDGGTLYQIPYRHGIAEDYFSTRGLLKQYRSLTGEELADVKSVYDRAIRGELAAKKVFADFGEQLAVFLTPWLRSFQADCLVLGGGISKAFGFFLEAMKKEFNKGNLPVEIMISKLGDKAAILGAASLIKHKETGCPVIKERRLSNQNLLPLHQPAPHDKEYEVYPAFHLENGKIYEGINSLADYIISQKTVVIDGYAGVFWDDLREEMERIFRERQLKVSIQDTRTWYLPSQEIDVLICPYLGTDDSVWGTKCDKELADLFDKEKLQQCDPDRAADINIVLGTGAALCHWQAPVIYFDLPKNELQFRMRAGSVTNLGCREPGNPVKMYKRFYFVDWVLLNRHKKNILERVEVIADSQRMQTITWMYMRDMRPALRAMSENVFRVRPWFEPGAWGGQWIKKNIAGISRDEVNYAWSFELITPENGLLFESDSLLLEISFDFLMFSHQQEVLGERFAKRFGDEFPIRFDFLDTVKGGNLSIQCHPSPAYIKKYFGENFTQDETYYILEAEKDAGVYLGFRENIDPGQFRGVLERSKKENIPVEVTDYVQYHEAKKHDLFLIPNGTVHSAAAGNLVLEISATPYIFTFKMYDWLRPGLDGTPRPINIEHAFNNLDFARKGEKVKRELISKPDVLNSGKDWKQVHLPTHPEHFYDIHRYEFSNRVQIKTEGSCQVLMLVEGSSVMLETERGFRQRFHYAETFVIPAAAKSYTLINEGKVEAKVVKAFLK